MTSSAPTPRSWFEHPDLVAFYSSHRNRPEDLYPSERRFLPWLARGARSVLDVGCGAGGFAAVWRHFSPELDYTGVDTSAPLVEAARERVPDATFLHADCVAGLPLPERGSDVVAALGWLHWEPQWRRALAELWRATDRVLFFDVRLQEGHDDLEASQRLALVGPWDGRTTVPYVAASWPALAEAIVALGPARVLAYGYWGAPADTVVGMPGEVCFATFVLERPPAGTEPLPPELALDLPLAWPPELADRVTLDPPGALAEAVPTAEEDPTP